jgi:hypothetical protein
VDANKRRYEPARHRGAAIQRQGGKSRIIKEEGGALMTLCVYSDTSEGAARCLRHRDAGKPAAGRRKNRFFESWDGPMRHGRVEGSSARSFSSQKREGEIPEAVAAKIPWRARECESGAKVLNLIGSYFVSGPLSPEEHCNHSERGKNTTSSRRTDISVLRPDILRNQESCYCCQTQRLRFGPAQTRC